MPIINFTPGDILRQKLLEEQWCGVEITAITGPTTASKGDSVNFRFEYTLDEKSPAPGKVITDVFNSKAIGMLIPLIAACRNVDVASITADPKALSSLNTDDLLHAKFDLKVIRELYEGQWNNKPGGYLPKGKGTAAPAF